MIIIIALVILSVYIIGEDVKKIDVIDIDPEPYTKNEDELISDLDRIFNADENIDEDDNVYINSFKRSNISSCNISSRNSYVSTNDNISYKSMSNSEIEDSEISCNSIDNSLVQSQDSLDSYIDKSLYDNGKYYKGEEDTRSIFEEIFKPHKFRTVRPDNLKNPYTGKNLEIDGLCRIKLGKKRYIYVGFEHQGAQHMKYVKKFHKSILDYEKQIMRDRWKFDKCKRLGIILIEVIDGMKNKKEFILRELKKYPELKGYYRER